MIYVIAFATRLVINIDIFSFIKKDKKMFCNINETIIKNGIAIYFFNIAYVIVVNTLALVIFTHCL